MLARIEFMLITRRRLLLYLAALTAGGAGISLCANSDEIDEQPVASNDVARDEKLVPLIYSANYNITAFGVERLHPFDGRKFSKIHKALLKTGMRRKEDFIRPAIITTDQLLTIHTKRYLESLKDGHVIGKILELGPLALLPNGIIDSRVLKPMRLASGGTILTCRSALQHGVAINIGGGYHHAERDKGGGFCVYCDVPIAIEILKREGKIKTAMIVDTDAHQGNGFANAAGSESHVFCLDFYDETIYPWPKVEEDWSIPFPRRTRGDKYLSTLEETLPKATEKFKPDLIVYNAGSDVLKSDPLSTFLLSPREMNERDLFVISHARKQSIPIAMVLAGGYSSESAMAHANSVKGIIEKFDKS